jgi:hypothetical protein
VGVTLTNGEIRLADLLCAESRATKRLSKKLRARRYHRREHGWQLARRMDIAAIRAMRAVIAESVSR